MGGGVDGELAAGVPGNEAGGARDVQAFAGVSGPVIEHVPVAAVLVLARRIEVADVLQQHIGIGAGDVHPVCAGQVRHAVRAGLQ